MQKLSKFDFPHLSALIGRLTVVQEVTYDSGACSAKLTIHRPAPVQLFLVPTASKVPRPTSSVWGPMERT